MYVISSSQSYKGKSCYGDYKCGRASLILLKKEGVCGYRRSRDMDGSRKVNNFVWTSHIKASLYHILSPWREVGSEKSETFPLCFLVCKKGERTKINKNEKSLKFYIKHFRKTHFHNLFAFSIKSYVNRFIQSNQKYFRVIFGL